MLLLRLRGIPSYRQGRHFRRAYKVYMPTPIKSQSRNEQREEQMAAATSDDLLSIFDKCPLHQRYWTAFSLLSLGFRSGADGGTQDYRAQRRSALGALCAYHPAPKGDAPPEFDQRAWSA
jgi:hypothetical protein